MFSKSTFLQAPDSPGSGTPAPQSTPPAPAPSQAPGSAPAPAPAPKTYSEEELNGIVARRKSEEVDSLLKDLGIESKGSLKDRIAALKKYEDEHKSELDKEKESRTTAEKARDEAISRAERAEAKAEALGMGVDPEKIDRFLKVVGAYDGDTMSAKVKAALEDLPDFKVQGVKIPNLKTPIKNQTTPEADAAKAAFNSALGIHKQA